MTPTAGPTIKRGQSSGDIWTPRVFINAVERKFGPLAWDLAASAENAKAPRFFTSEQDALKQNWVERCHGLSWLNPPYGNIARWAGKCAWESTQGWTGLLLVPASVGANWFWEGVWPYATVYSVGRMAFDNCFDKEGRLVTTPYPKDLILAHYAKRNQLMNGTLQRWEWRK